MIPATISRNSRNQKVGGQRQGKQETQFQQLFRKMSSDILHVIVAGDHTAKKEDKGEGPTPKERLQIRVKPNRFGSFEVLAGEHLTEPVKQVFAFTTGPSATKFMKLELEMLPYERERVIMIDGQLYSVYTDNERQFTFSPGTAEAASKINELLDDLMEGLQ